MVVFCDEIDLSVSQALAFIHTQGVQKEGQTITFKTLVIKAPSLWKDWLFEDFAKISGATIIDGVTNTLAKLKLEQLGSVSKITTTKDQTICTGIRDISEHLKVLEDLNTDEAKIRIARLCTKTAILKLGANSESELSYLKGKALDARNAAYLALQGGIVNGGGITYTGIKLPNTIGGNILSKALEYPSRQIIENSGQTVNNRFLDIKDIFDPAIVVKNSIINAISVAGTVLTAKAIITQSK
jgi:chaperonin GroEL (HSP60 family)